MNTLDVRSLGRVDYAATYEQQRSFTLSRNESTGDQLWCLEHPPVYTLGVAGKPEHILNSATIPVHRTDRGGQVTYHGPGQLVLYPLLDLKRKGISIRNYVNLLEQSIIDLLEHYGIAAVRREGAPGVYVVNSKIAALGIRVRNGCCYHGLALNVDLDLAPFAGINPCGYAGMEVTRLKDLGIDFSVEQVCDDLVPLLKARLGYDESRAPDLRELKRNRA